MITRRYKTWKSFYTRFLSEYHGLDEIRRRQLIFRGQADSRWDLQASLDRLREFPSVAERQACLDRLISEFRRQARIIDPTIELDSSQDWELLGRHHGLPTTVLDFTASPYIAAWFAFEDSAIAGARCSSIWMLDREAFEANPVDQIAVLGNDEAIRFNPRAKDQQGLFLKVSDVSAGSPEAVLSDALTRHDIPCVERRIILGMLEDMTITARTMYSDLRAAAQAAASRVLVISGKE
jgi:FRG domain